MTLPALIFDLDGTLVHSQPDIRRALNVAFPEAPFSPAEVQAMVGAGVPTLIRRAMAARGMDGDEEHARRKAAFEADYNAAPAALTRPYPGVVPALQALARAGHVLALCTNKPQAPARAILAGLDLAQLFPVVIGGDSLPYLKPDPRALLDTIRQTGAARALFVGDSEVDAETARAAGVPFVLFSGGYRKAPAETLGAAAIFDAFTDLPGLILRLSQA